MDNWATPKWLMKIFEDWFDPCPLNGEGGLDIEWDNETYVNPPYSKIMPWVEKAIEERNKGKKIVMLLPVNSDTKWYLKLVENKARFLFIHGRLKYLGEQKGSGAARFASMLVIL